MDTTRVLAVVATVALVSASGCATIFGNIAWLLPGVIIDGFSGGMWEFKDKSLIVPLEAMNQSRVPATTAPVTPVQQERHNQGEPGAPQSSGQATGGAERGADITY